MREIPFGRPIIGDEERSAVNRVLMGNVLVHGPKAREFEVAFSVYTDAPSAVSVSSCTAGLHLCYFYLGLKPGDEVIVPAQTHAATAHAVELTGAKPVFVDAEIETGNIDVEQIESRITERTRAISVVHYLGMPVNMDRVMALARSHNLFVVEDCALAIGTRYRGIHAGLLGDAGAFSFYPVKHMTTAEGGMVITKDPAVAATIARQKAFGVDRTVAERSTPGIYDVTMLGFNYRLSEIQAAIGVEQLKRVDDFLAKRRSNYQLLTDGLKEIEEVSLFKSTGGQFQSSYYCQSVLLDNRRVAQRPQVIEYLNRHGVGTSIYYPKPVPHLSYYKNKYGYGDETFPVAARISDSSIALPVGPHLNADDMRYIVSTLKGALQWSNR